MFAGSCDVSILTSDVFCFLFLDLFAELSVLTIMASQLPSVPPGVPKDLDTCIFAKIEVSEVLSAKVEVPEIPAVKLEVPELPTVKLEVPEVLSAKLEVPEVLSAKLEVPEVLSAKLEVPDVPSTMEDPAVGFSNFPKASLSSLTREEHSWLVHV